VSNSSSRTKPPTSLSERYDTDEPWICWRFLTTDRRTRLTGRSVVLLDCCVCGQTRKVRIRIPRFGPIPDRGEHPERIRFKLDHLHPDKGHPMSWAKPLRNPFGQRGGLDLDMLAMRLEADLRKALNGQ
jgi:hypothetical protein